MNTLTNQLHGRWEMFLFNQSEVQANSNCKPFSCLRTTGSGGQVAEVCGEIDYQFRIGDGLPAVEWSWAGEQTTAGDNSMKQPPRDKVHGRGRAVV